MRTSMTCEEIEAAELAEKYVLGHLDRDDQAAYESHYFRCSRCFEELQLRQAMQTELIAIAADRPAQQYQPWRRSWITWGALAAMLALATGLGVWRFVEAPSPKRESRVVRTAPKPARSEPSLYMLARVEPPPYTPPALRSAAPIDTR